MSVEILLAVLLVTCILLYLLIARFDIYIFRHGMWSHYYGYAVKPEYERGILDLVHNKIHPNRKYVLWSEDIKYPEVNIRVKKLFDGMIDSGSDPTAARVFCLARGSLSSGMYMEQDIDDRIRSCVTSYK